MTQNSAILHATTVSIDGKGVMILGPSGSGKSSLALQLIALGALLVTDDRTEITRSDQTLIAAAPSAIAGMIEARGVGILRLSDTGATPLSLAIDLSQPNEPRLPETHCYSILGLDLPCLYPAPSPHFAAAIWLYVRGTLDTPV